MFWPKRVGKYPKTLGSQDAQSSTNSVQPLGDDTLEWLPTVDAEHQTRRVRASVCGRTALCSHAGSSYYA